MAPIAPGALAESASAKMRFLYSAEYWRRLALTTTSGSGIVLASPGATLRSASLRSASLRSAPGEAKTTEGGGTPFTDFFMSISFSALYTKSRKGRRLTDLGTEGNCSSNMHPYATDSNERSKVNAGLAFLSVLAALLLNRNISFPNSVSRRLRKYASLKDGHQSREFFEQFASWLALCAKISETPSLPGF